ncbi:unnamed protein product [Rhizophagus irregularis]|nr:unnamed protein product [Rhizophagus irregularis]CAB4441037.1 unnamed protein product [Rhizophagus irregularis]
MASTCLTEEGLFKNKGSFRRIQLGKTKRFFGGLTLGNEKPKGTLDVWIMYFETNGSGRLDNGNQNEPVFTSFYFGIGH